MADEPLSEDQINRIKSSIEKRAKELADAHMDLLIQAGPVLQSADFLKNAIDEIVACVHGDQFELAADLGYKELSSHFIWLQRTLGSLKEAALHCSDAIAEVAGDCGLAHEQVKPLVVEYFQSLRETLLTEEERRKRVDEMLANIRHPQ